LTANLALTITAVCLKRALPGGGEFHPRSLSLSIAYTFTWTFYNIFWLEISTCIYNISKVGIRNLSSQLRNFAILQTTKSIAELQTKKSFGIAIADLQNLTSAILQLSTVSCQFCYVLVPFPQLRMVLKINQKYF
jgi:hypothetical protein